MYPSEWAASRVETLAHQHGVVWVEDPYGLIGADEIEQLRHRLGLAGHSVIAVQNGLDLRQELLPHEPGKGRLVIIAQSFTLRDPHLLPKDAKPSDLVPLAAPDWKPFLDEGARFRPTVQGFLEAVTEDPRWPVEVNIYPYEQLARSDPDAFVRAYDSFRQTGKALTSGDLVLVGASAALQVDLVDISDPLLALELAFHSDDKWRRLHECFNATEVEQVRARLQALPPPLGDLFGPRADTARLAVTALLILRQHAEDPGVHLPVLSPALASYADCSVAAATEAPAWFLEREVPSFEQLITPKFAKYLRAKLPLNSEHQAREFAARERFSGKLRNLVLPLVHVPVPPPTPPLGAGDFSLGRLVPDFRDAKQRLHELVRDSKPRIDGLRLTPLRAQTAKMVLDAFDQAGMHQIDSLSGQLNRLIRDIEGPARPEWQLTPGFEQRWAEEVRECRDSMTAAGRLRADLDYLFGRLLEARYPEIIPQKILSARSFYEQFMCPRRRLSGGGLRRAVILVIDGMRFDLWRHLIRPALERDYEVEESIGFSELPSVTRISRFSFFAGKPPGQLPASMRESDMFAALLAQSHGLAVTFEDVPGSRPGLRFAVRSKDSLTLAGVFDFADSLAHHIDWDPHTVQASLQPFVHEIRAVLAAEGPETRVFITSDHGHYLHERGSPIFIENAADVGYRSAYLSQRVEGIDGQHLFQIPAATLGHNLPGLFIFPKPFYYLRSREAEQGPGRPGAGYRHGGLSLFEVAIPLVCLTHRAAPTTVHLAASIKGRPAVGTPAAVEVSLTADGIIQSPVRLSADTEDLESVIITGISTSPTSHVMRFTPAAPGRRRIEITAHLGDQQVGATRIEIEVASPPAPEDEAKIKLRKLFGED